MDASNVSNTQTTQSLTDLQSPQQRRVLDAVDELRKCGLAKQLSLPQIVVCGDQSSGKSSVLEALTEISFPRADLLCTRFATQFSLRRAPQEGLSVQIVPDQNRPAEEQASLSSFSATITKFSQLAADLPAIVEKARKAMGIDEVLADKPSRTFARDVLSIAIEGPERPQLTVVDLPGLFQNENSSGDKALVEKLTKLYIQQPRTICLAIITAANDVDNQGILTSIKKVDPQGNRSLGIITKPDLAPRGSKSERYFIDLASNKNKQYFFKLGWHVLKNRTFEERDVSLEKRNDIEGKFFHTSNFKELPKSSVGIDALRTRLSTVLFDHVKQELPSIRKEVEVMVGDTRNSLEHLGPSRSNANECREYLMDMSEHVQRISRYALMGHYEDAYFQTDEFLDFEPESPWATRRLRALLQQTNETFAEQMQGNGHTLCIGPEPWEDDYESQKILDEDLEGLKQESVEPIEVSYDLALAWAGKMISRNRGRELQGEYSPLVVSELFWFQSRRWKAIAEDHIDVVANIVSRFMRSLLGQYSTKDVLDNVWTQELEETLAARKEKAKTRLLEIMRSFRGHPINHNPYYTEVKIEMRNKRNMERLRVVFDNLQLMDLADRPPSEIDRLVAMLPNRTEDDMLRASCEDALDCMRSIYELKQKVFIDVVLTLVVEEHIATDLENLLSPKTVGRLSDDELTSLASEPEDIKNSRDFHQDQLDKLLDGQKILRSVVGGTVA